MPSSDKSSNRILITGASGAFGAVVRYGLQLCPLPHQVHLHGRRVIFDTPYPYHSLPLETGKRAWEELIESIRPGLILHLAGAVHTSGYSELEMLRLNRDCARMVAEAATNSGVGTFFFASTAGVYGDQTPEAPLHFEGSALAPLSAYARSKQAAELAVNELQGVNGMRVCSLRYATTGGSDLLFRNALAATRDNPLLLDTFADGSTPSRSYLGAADIGQIHKRLFELALSESSSAIALPPVLNISTTGAVEMSELLGEYEKVSETEIFWSAKSASPKALKRCELSTRLLNQVLGWQVPKGTPRHIAEQVSEFSEATI